MKPSSGYDIYRSPETGSRTVAAVQDFLQLSILLILAWVVPVTVAAVMEDTPRVENGDVFISSGSSHFRTSH